MSAPPRDFDPADYNWRAAFEYAGFDGGDGGRACSGEVGLPGKGQGFDGEVRPVAPADVKRVVAAIAGEPDDSNWLGLFELQDGAFLFLSAGCDYTGWGCRDGGGSLLFATEADAIRWGPGDEERSRLGLPLPSRPGGEP